GGFSAMKRYPFFSTLSNWFCPFYTEHPDLQGIYKGDISPKIVNALLNAVPFCDSDKYSFALTMDVVVQKIPKQMLELLGTGELKSMEDYAQLPKFAILLRNYLQDLFRFFRLCPMNTKFVNIFDKEKCLFITNPVFSKCAFTRKTANVARLIKKNDNYDYFEYLVLHASIETPDMLGIIANYHFGCGQIDVAERLFMELYKKNPESKTAIRGLARVYASAERYDEVLKMYELLEGIDPGKISTKLNIAVCMTHIDKTDEAIKMLAKLNYENPNHANILSCFGWAYLVSGNIDMALKKYLSAVEAEDATTYDHFMLGIAYFCAGDIAKAADEIIQDFLPEDTYDDVNDAISEECADVSDMYDLTFAKQIALSDIVYNRLKRQE
ncbi:MAG: hypothetical protein Q4F34_05265, partial [Prevotellaceae bacterium]|nr:hypothetical protein [Prevotellaceae bacterium]